MNENQYEYKYELLSSINDINESNRNSLYYLFSDENGIISTYTENQNIISEEIPVNIYYNKDDNFIYSYDLEKKEYTIYNQDLTIKYNLNISDYDYSDIPKLYLVNGNTIIIDEASELYFNYEDGKMIDNFNNYETELDGIKLSFNGKKKTVELKKDNETLKYTFEYSYQNHKLYEEKDNTIYYIMNNKYIAFIKGE